MFVILKYKYLAYIFIIGSISGWFLEVLLIYIRSNEYANRGLLELPLLPIYGFGLVIVFVLSEYFYDFIVTRFDQKKLYIKLFLLEFISFLLLLSILEFCSGLILDKVFDLSLWNYTNNSLNIGGYISLKSSMFFSVSATLTSILLYNAFLHFLKYVSFFSDFIMTILFALITLDLFNIIF